MISELTSALEFTIMYMFALRDSQTQKKSSTNLRTRLWSVALPHVTYSSEWEVYITTIRTCPIIIASWICKRTQQNISSWLSL